MSWKSVTPVQQTKTADGPGVSHAEELDPRAALLAVMLRLRWFIRLRWGFVGAAVASLALEHVVWHDVRRPPALVGLLTGLGVVNLVWTLISRALFDPRRHTVASPEAKAPYLVAFANAQVVVDLLLLTGILRYTGGVENPFAVFYLFHMAIVSFALIRWQAILQAAWALALYSTLAIGEWQQWITPHFDLLPWSPLGIYTRPGYVLTALAAVASGIVGALYFNSWIGEHFQSQEGDLHRANAGLQKAQLAIQDLQRRRSRFMQTAAHQLKSPLAVIQTLTDLIRSQVVSPEAVAGTCDKVIRRCQDGIAQVTELLTLARVQEADPARHRQSQTDVREVVAELCRRVRPLAEGKQIELLEWAPPEGNLYVNVDAHDLRDCLNNLIENAIKYTPGPGRVRVMITSKQENGQIESVGIHISDTGIGIDPSLLQSPDGEPGREPIFDAFRRGANVITAGIPGTGLGLSIVREVVEQAGGRIGVLSRVGAGSSFTVTLPASSDSAAQSVVRDTRATKVVLEAADGPALDAAAGPVHDLSVAQGSEICPRVCIRPAAGQSAGGATQQTE
jgi:signal transduction histidine kinase